MRMQREALNDSKGKGSCGDEDAELKGAESEMKVAQSSLTLCDPHVLYSPWNSPGKNTGIGSLSFLQGNFPTQGSNPGLPHCRRVLYQLSHKPKDTGVGSLSLLQWIFPTQESNWGLLHCRWILYQLSYQGVGRAGPWFLKGN